MTRKSSTERHEIELHLGAMLWSVAQTYPTLHLTLLEMVQNALDARATRIYVGVDLQNCRVAVLDNGDGVTVDHFRKALGSVGQGIKKKGSLGQFGRGLVSPISLCEKMLFLSSPPGEKVHQWMFIGEQLRRKARELSIPFADLDQFPQLPRPFTFASQEARLNKREKIEWRTMVLLDNVTRDTTVQAVDVKQLAHDIRTKFGSVMRRLGARVQVKLQTPQGELQQQRVDPTEYRGQPLEIVRYNEASCGQVELKFYVAPLRDGKRQGTVVLRCADDEFVVPVREAQTQAMGARAFEQMDTVRLAFNALCSGYFEGEISAENIVLSPERNKFELNDALRELYVVLAMWYEEHGEAYLNNAKSEQQEERYAKLGEQSLNRLMQQIQSGGLSSLADGLRQYFAGSRVTRPERKAPSTATPRKKRGARRLVKARPEQQQSGNSPVSGFLQFEYETLVGSTRLWEFNYEERILTLNIRHPLWVQLDETNGRHTARNDRQIMALQEWLAFKLLLGLADGHDAETIDAYCREVERESRSYVPVFIVPMK